MVEYLFCNKNRFMFKKLILLFTFFLIQITNSKADWNNINFPFNDHLNSIFVNQFNTNNALIAGNEGIYFTNTSVNGTWVKLQITGSMADQILYNATQFKRIGASSNNDSLYICGEDTVNHRAVIFTFNLVSHNYSVSFIGSNGTSLNGIFVRGQYIIAVGNAGYLVAKYDVNPYQIYNTNTTQNLYAVSANFSNKFAVVGHEVHLDIVTNGNNLTINTYSANGQIMKAIAWNNPGYTAAGTSYYYLTTITSPSLTEINSYDFGLLDANGLSSLTNGDYVATNHGIFKAIQSQQRLEYQPSSNGQFFSDIFFQLNNTQNGYACGPNSLLMATTDGGGPTKPFCTFNLSGACKGATKSLSGNAGSGTNCIWKINGAQVSTNCATNYTFSNAGLYDVEYIVWNSAMFYDTALVQVNFVDTPSVNFNYIIVDSFLCKNQALELVIQGSENNVNYGLYQGANAFGNVAGNGSVLTLLSDSTIISGVYVLRASSNTVNCFKNFTPNVQVTKENTKSKFHVNHINAQINEEVIFNALSVDASHYQWEFDGGASILNDTNKTVYNQNFSQLGTPNISLISWSNHGCYDTLITQPLAIVNEPLSDQYCWAINMDDEESNPPIGWSRISKIKGDNENILATGNGLRTTIKSRYGNQINQNDSINCYVVDYSKNGLLKRVLSTAESGFLIDICKDSQENFYIIGNQDSEAKNKDNFGDYYHYAEVPGLIIPGNVGYITKLDKNGKYVWSNQLLNATPQAISYDEQGNLIILANIFNSNFCSYFYNGVEYAIQNNFPDCDAINALILKIDTSGQYVWATYVATGYNSSNMAMTVDSLGNIILGGELDFQTHFFDAGNTTTPSQSYIASSLFGSTQSYVVKYNAQGEYQWYNILKANSGNYKSVVLHDIKTDANGSVYVCGENEILNITDTLIFLNNSGNQLQINIGSYFVGKISQDGFPLWIQGTSQVANAMGCAIEVSQNTVTCGGLLKTPNAPYFSTASFTTGQLNNLLLDVFEAGYFIAEYDLMGNLIQISQTGDTSGAAASNSVLSLCRNTNGDLFLGANMSTNVNSNPFVFFNDTLTISQTDGILAKKGSVCGSIVTIVKSRYESNGGLLVYPNPSSGIINLRMIEENYAGLNEIVIYDYQGKQIFNVSTNKNNITLDLKAMGIQAGIYIVKVGDTSNQKAHRFIYSQ